MPRATGNDNLNTKSYWNKIYKDVIARAQYALQGTDESHAQLEGGQWIGAQPTSRFTTALKHVEAGDKVLDMGCGVGVFTKLTKEMYPENEVWGTDISDRAIEDNKKENSEIKYFHGYIGDQGFLPKEYFDVVFCGETIEHLEDPNVLFKEAYSVLKEGGKLIITTPKEEHIRSEEHLWYFKQEDVEQYFLNNGYNNIRFEYLPDLEHMYVIFAVGERV